MRGLRAYECRVAIIGEKMETREIKDKMAEFFATKDVTGAKDYFAKCLKIRPDVLMEASDITGECKLCLQAVSTANLELANNGECFLDMRKEYMEVIRFFRQLNAIVQKIIRGETQDIVQDKAWLEQEKVSDIALLAAIRIYAVNAEQSDFAWQQLQ